MVSGRDIEKGVRANMSVTNLFFPIFINCLCIKSSWHHSTSMRHRMFRCIACWESSICIPCRFKHVQSKFGRHLVPQNFLQSSSHHRTSWKWLCYDIHKISVSYSRRERLSLCRIHIETTVILDYWLINGRASCRNPSISVYGAGSSLKFPLSFPTCNALYRDRADGPAGGGLGST
jgi:hypothetical protein